LAALHRDLAAQDRHAGPGRHLVAYLIKRLAYSRPSLTGPPILKPRCSPTGVSFVRVRTTSTPPQDPKW
jgi:hypothetical protein